MAAIASVYPDPVLSNIMPVFTFMGANVLRQDDNYSFLVIQQTLEKVIPPLVAFQRKNTADSFTVTDVKPVMKVFVDALLHIPKHRRLRLFTVLVSTLGEDDFLHPVIALILEKNILVTNLVSFLPVLAFFMIAYVFSRPLAESQYQS
jgi:U3 small nucleolar RNA-associated protein 10